MKTKSRTTALALAFTSFSLACGGPVGIETSVQAGGALNTIIFLFLSSLLWALPQALVSAELSTRIPSSGGSIDWVFHVLGPVWGTCNAVALLFNQLFDLPLYPLLFTASLRQVVPGMSNALVIALQFAVIAVSAAVNIVGVDAVLSSATVLTVAILAPFAVMPIVAAGYHVPFTWVGLNGQQTPPNFTGTWGVFVAGILWNLQGWTGIGNLAEEVDSVSTVLPRGLFWGVVLAFFSYSYSVAFGAVSDGSIWDTGNNPGPGVADWSSWDDGHLVDIASSIRPWFGIVAGVAAGIASLSTCISSLASNARTVQAAASMRVLPVPWLGRDMTRWRTPVPAILLLSATTAGLMFVDLTNLLQLDTLFANCSVAIVVLAFLTLRVQQHRATGGRKGGTCLTRHLPLPPLANPLPEPDDPATVFHVPGSLPAVYAIFLTLLVFIIFSFVVVFTGLWWAAAAPLFVMLLVALVTVALGRWSRHRQRQTRTPQQRYDRVGDGAACPTAGGVAHAPAHDDSTPHPTVPLLSTAATS